MKTVSSVLSYHLFIHSFIFANKHIQIQQQYTEIYDTLKIIYFILTKLFTRSNVESINGKEAYVEAKITIIS